MVLSWYFLSSKGVDAAVTEVWLWHCWWPGLDRAECGGLRRGWHREASARQIPGSGAGGQAEWTFRPHDPQVLVVLQQARHTWLRLCP